MARVLTTCSDGALNVNRNFGSCMFMVRMFDLRAQLLVDEMSKLLVRIQANHNLVQ